MRHLKMLGVAAFAAIALMAFASTTSATTLEITGSAEPKAVTIKASLTASTTATLRDTFGFSANTCTESNVHGITEFPFSGTKVTGEIMEFKFAGCSNPVTVHNPGKLYIEHINNVTNGTVYSENAEVTVWSSIHGTYINCKTGTGTLLGTLTGVKHGHAELDINATLNCEPHLSSAKWVGTYIVTSPTDLGVSP